MCAKGKGNWWHWVGCGLVAVLFGWLILNTDFKSFWLQLGRLPWWLLPVLLGLQVLTQLLITYQWHHLTGLVLGCSHFAKLLHIFARGTVIEGVTPGAKIGGEAVRLYLIKREFSCTTSEAVSIIAMQKSISMSVLLSLCLAALLHIGSRIASHLPICVQALSGALCLPLVLGMMWLLFFAKPLSQFLETRQGKLARKAATAISAYATATAQLTPRHWGLQFAISTMVWLLFPVKMVILATTLGVHLPFAVVFSVTMVSYMMGMFPLTPGGIGTFEGTMLALLSLLGVGYTLGLSITLVFRFVTFWFVILGSTALIALYQIYTKCKGDCYDCHSPSDTQHP